MKKLLYITIGVFGVLIFLLSLVFFSGRIEEIGPAPSISPFPSVSPTIRPGRITPQASSTVVPTPSVQRVRVEGKANLIVEQKTVAPTPQPTPIPTPTPTVNTTPSPTPTPIICILGICDI